MNIVTGKIPDQAVNEILHVVNNQLNSIMLEAGKLGGSSASCQVVICPVFGGSDTTAALGFHFFATTMRDVL